MKYFILLGFILTSNLALAGKLKGKIIKPGDNGMISIIIKEMDSRSSDRFFELAKRNPQASVVLSGDLNGDGQLEHYTITPIRCPDGTCSSSLIVGSHSNIDYGSSSFSFNDNAGMPSKDHVQGLYRTNSRSISGASSSIMISKVVGSSESKKFKGSSSVNLKLILISSNPNEIQSFRKGWDGSIKGGKRVVLNASLDLVSSDSQSTSTSPQQNPQSSIAHLNLTLSSELGSLELNSATQDIDQQKLDSILTLIR